MRLMNLLFGLSLALTVYSAQALSRLFTILDEASSFDDLHTKTLRKER